MFYYLYCIVLFIIFFKDIFLSGIYFFHWKVTAGRIPNPDQEREGDDTKQRTLAGIEAGSLR